jgi:hypothetical protein
MWRSSIISALYRPWIVRAFRIRASPSAVLGPVLLPPCIRQRPFGIAGCRHGCPLRIRAPQRGQDHANGSVVRQSGRRRMGLPPHLVRTSSPSSATGCDASNNGLPSWMDMYVLDADNPLTTFAALAVRRR